MDSIEQRLAKFEERALRDEFRNAIRPLEELLQRSGTPLAWCKLENAFLRDGSDPADPRSYTPLDLQATLYRIETFYVNSWLTRRTDAAINALLESVRKKEKRNG